MKTIRVNADYEAELFLGKKAPPIINQSLEFLAFYLENKPVLTQKKYSEEYLEYVQKISGQRPILVNHGSYENWWGPLVDLEEERRLNSKITSAELNIQMGWPPQTYLLTKIEEAELVEWNQDYLVKDPWGMSGQGLKTIKRAEDLPALTKPLILEPLLERKFDFSHYVYPEGKLICYQNLVDRHFQYRGSLFSNLKEPTLQQLSFYSKISKAKWQNFEKALTQIQDRWPKDRGYSVDSFIYEVNGELEIRYLSEINCRRTMGATAFELAQKYATGNWALFMLGKTSGKMSFKEMLQLLAPLSPNVLLLSPDDVRFQMLLIAAENETEGKELVQKVKALLPDSQFAIEI